MLTLNATVNNANSYQWNTGAVTPIINVTQQGLYWCQVTMQNCSFRDSLTILSIKPMPVVNLGNDQIHCEGITTTLDATYLNSTYLWQDGTTNPVYNVSQQGVYTVQVNFNGCKSSDTIIINYILKPRFTLGPDQMICPGNSIILNPTLNPTWQIRWHDGTTNPTHTVTQPGNYSLSATNNCGTTQDDITVSKGICKVYCLCQLSLDIHLDFCRQLFLAIIDRQFDKMDALCHKSDFRCSLCRSTCFSKIPRIGYATSRELEYSG